jgi:hypothetical protein
MKHKIKWRSQAQGRAMIHAICGRPLILEDKVRSQSSRRGICSGQSVTLRAFPPSTSVFPCQVLSTNAPYSFIHLPLILQQMTLINQKPATLHPAINVIIPVINVLSNDGHGVRNRYEMHGHLGLILPQIICAEPKPCSQHWLICNYVHQKQVYMLVQWIYLKIKQGN